MCVGAATTCVTGLACGVVELISRQAGQGNPTTRSTLPQAGFALLESGTVQRINVKNILLKV